MQNCWAFNKILNLSRTEEEFNHAILMWSAIIDLERNEITQWDENELRDRKP